MSGWKRFRARVAARARVRALARARGAATVIRVRVRAGGTYDAAHIVATYAHWHRMQCIAAGKRVGDPTWN